jgi:hypothetical protein
MCLIGQPYDELDKDVETGIGIPHPSKPSSEAMSDNTTLWYCIKLSVCVVGLQFTYLTWGLLQVSISVHQILLCFMIIHHIHVHVPSTIHSIDTRIHQ